MSLQPPMPEAHPLAGAPLGKAVAYPGAYDAGLLYAIDRAPLREALGFGATLPFLGADVWNAYELSWRNPRGKPQVALASLVFLADSPRLIESKSLKLYLNSLADSHFDGMEAVRERIVADLTAAAGSRVDVQLLSPDALEGAPLTELPGLLLDRLDVDCSLGFPDARALSSAAGAEPVEETLATRLFRSNCPVTGQPDWASVQISYLGAPVDQAGLLRYLVGYRSHDAFHEQCVEQIWCDIMRQCRPQRLTVQARYTRRGGLDINPWRSNVGGMGVGNLRHPRQ